MTSSQNDPLLDLLIQPKSESDRDDRKHHHSHRHHHHHRSHRSKKSKKKRWIILLIVLLLLLTAILVPVGIGGWMFYQGQKELLTATPPVITPPEDLVEIPEDKNDGETVVYNGVTYRYNKNVTAILVAGIDKKGIQNDSAYGKNGQADTLFLTTLDTKTGDIHIIPLSRETIVDVDRYAVDGTYMGVEQTQLCLAYAYASTGEEGCDNVARSVSRLLYGVPINSYVAIDLDGIKAVTEVVGGVTLTSLEDIPHPREGYTLIREGEKVTLSGNKALYYLRHRGNDKDANNRRMQRLKQFFSAFIAQAGGRLKKNIGLLPRYYNTAKPYIVTDLSLSKLTYLVGNILSGSNWSNPDYLSISGETVQGEKYVEFHADPTSTYEAVLEAFYIREEASQKPTNPIAKPTGE